MAEEIARRIAAWRDAGLIDAATAESLRAYEAARSAAAETAATEAPPAAEPPAVEPATSLSQVAARTGPLAGLASALGPGLGLDEMLGYLGSAFVLGAWYVAAGERFIGSLNVVAMWAVTTGVAAAVLVAIGLLIRGLGERGRRAAGMAFVVAVGNAVAAGATAASALADVPFEVTLLVGSIVGLVLAAALRLLHPALLTQAALLGAVVLATVAAVQNLERAMLPFGDGYFDPGFGMSSDLATRWLLVDLAAWWACAVILGLVGAWEAASRAAPADRRAALSRAAAGLVAVGSTAGLLTRSVPIGNHVERLVPAWGAAAIVLAISGLLLWLAFRRETSAYLYPAALGIVLALSDLNATYVEGMGGTAAALVFEGAILLVGGLVASRLRRRISALQRMPDSG